MSLQIIDLVDAEQFSSLSFPEKALEIQADRISIGDRSFDNPILSGHYDGSGKFRLHFKCDPDIRFILGLADSAELFGAKNRIELLVGRAFVGPDLAAWDLIPTRQPATFDFGDNCVSVEAVVVNAPDTGRHKDRTFVYGDFQADYEQFPQREILEREKTIRKYGRFPVGKLTLKRTDGGLITPESAWTELSHISNFFCLVRGGSTGITHAIGRGSRLEPVFLFGGTSPCDHFLLPRSWYIQELRGELDALYTLYRQAMSGVHERAIRRALAFYRASNSAQDVDLNVAMIASHTSLETLVPHILLTIGGWSSRLVEKKDIDFNDKMRAAAKSAGLDADLFQHSSKLRALSQSNNKVDGFELISRIRNKIVHADAKHSYAPEEMYDAWQLSQWLFEVLIFSLLGYKGKMSDRRRRIGYVGELVPVPLS